MPYDPVEYAKGKEVLVRVHHIEKTYQRGAEITHALRNISLEIYRGEYPSRGRVSGRVYSLYDRVHDERLYEVAVFEPVHSACHVLYRRVFGIDGRRRQNRPLGYSRQTVRK